MIKTICNTILHKKRGIVAIIEIMIKTICNTIYSLCRICKNTNFFLRKQFQKSRKERILRILGNGKSLNDNSFDNDNSVDYMVVNRHVLSDNYQEIKPTYYVLADPFFFFHDNGIDIIKLLNKKTTWDMSLCVPYSRKVKKIIEKYVTNKHIHFIYYNATSFKGFNKIAYFLYSKGYSMPVVQNVLVACIMLGILLRYGKMELYGVEHSWTKFLYVGDDNNVYLENLHFYDNGKVTAKTLKEIQCETEYPLYLILENYSRMFKSYWEIKKYVEAYKIPIIIVNRTKGSFIDAFNRD